MTSVAAVSNNAADGCRAGLKLLEWHQSAGAGGRGGRQASVAVISGINNVWGGAAAPVAALQMRRLLVAAETRGLRSAFNTGMIFSLNRTESVFEVPSKSIGRRHHGFRQNQTCRGQHFRTPSMATEQACEVYRKVSLLGGLLWLLPTANLQTQSGFKL